MRNIMTKAELLHNTNYAFLHSWMSSSMLVSSYNEDICDTVLTSELERDASACVSQQQQQQQKAVLHTWCPHCERQKGGDIDPVQMKFTTSFKSLNFVNEECVNEAPGSGCKSAIYHHTSFWQMCQE